jgi:ribonuclease J
MPQLRIVPLGGLGEVGKNMMCVEYGDSIVVIDAGIMFPESDMLGIDHILPDWGYLRDRRHLVRAVLITHGHQDHIGALPRFLAEFNVPVFATPLTRGLIEVGLRRARLSRPPVLHTYGPGDEVTLGPFKIEPYHVCHSIPDSVGLGITTPAGLVVHSGDFKLDHTPVDGWPTDFPKLAEFNGRGVLVLLSDSTYSNRPGFTLSESALNDVFDEMMRQAPGRVIVATFASLISRIQQVVDSAVKHDRKVAIAGRTMVENTRMARRLGYLDIPEGSLLTLSEIRGQPARQTVILATGTQGEPTAALSRLSMGNHPTLRIREGDTVLLSSHTIPGNEEMTHRVINRLFQRGAEVLYDAVAPVHVSGHASQEEQKLLIDLLQPTFFVPIHGELRHLTHHGNIARQVGVPEQNVAVVENGYPLIFDDRLTVGDRIPGGYVFVDGARAGEIGQRVMQERENLSRGGFLMFAFRHDRRSGLPSGRARIVTRGFVSPGQSAHLLAEAEEVGLLAARVPNGTPDSEVEALVRAALTRFVQRETGRTPEVIAVALSA